MKNLDIWDKLRRPPKEALKTIKGGRLSGMSDVNPQWRIKAMTEQFGAIGFGWKYRIAERWNEHLDNQVACFVKIELFYKVGDVWSEPVEGLGGSMLLTMEKNGLYCSDEGYKMALTDALSVAMKQLGVAADIYAGLWDGSKYKDAKPESEQRAEIKEPTKEEQAVIDAICKGLKPPEGMEVDAKKVAAILCANNKNKYPSETKRVGTAVAWLEGAGATKAMFKKIELPNDEEEFNKAFGPNAEEQKAILALVVKLQGKSPEGFDVNPDKVGKAVFEYFAKYPSPDMSVAEKKKVMTYLTNHTSLYVEEKE